MPGVRLVKVSCARGMRGMDKIELRHVVVLVAAWPALSGCTDSGVVGSVRVPSDLEGSDGGPSGTADGAAASGGDCGSYFECVLSRVASLTHDECVRDGVACGALTPAEAANTICTARHTRCLDVNELPECAQQLEQCRQDPWQDGGPPPGPDGGT